MAGCGPITLQKNAIFGLKSCSSAPSAGLNQKVIVNPDETKLFIAVGCGENAQSGSTKPSLVSAATRKMIVLEN